MVIVFDIFGFLFVFNGDRLILDDSCLVGFLELKVGVDELSIKNLIQ